MPPSSSRPPNAPQVLPYLYYANATQVLTFLVDAFGFAELEAFRDEHGDVFHAQLSTGDGVVMIGPGMAEFGTRPVPDRADATARVFVYVDDVDGHCEQARAGGAAILTEPSDLGPNRIYVARDCGGQEWIFARPLA